MNDKILWIWLSLVCTPGNETFAKLISKFETPENVYSAEEYEISSAIGSKSRDFSAIKRKDVSSAERIYEYCVKKNVGILTYSDEKFPKALREISNPPVLLYYRGVLPNFNELFCVSIVGTRRLSEYGRKNALEISSDLATAGATVVSGMALGVDGVAHAGALNAGGITIAFLGSGIDVCYPIEHKPLAREIVKTGCVFTEYAPGTKPEKVNFPRRNRLISGISEATLVIEGRERSGALSTARYAKKQNKPVYALPGNVGNPNSQLTNLLIKNGAKLFTAADDIIRDYQDICLGKLNPFLLQERTRINEYEVLKKYAVAALTSNDRIFRHSRKKDNEKQYKNETYAPEENLPTSQAQREPVNFDSETLKLYKKIPPNAECSIESLVDSEFTLRKIMKGLLKLEMGSFIVMLPGEKVKRNF